LGLVQSALFPGLDPQQALLGRSGRKNRSQIGNQRLQVGFSQNCVDPVTHKKGHTDLIFRKIKEPIPYG